MNISDKITDPIHKKLFAVVAEVSATLGVDAYAVGGYVRDLLLGVSKNDIDIVVIGSGPDFAQEVAIKSGSRGVQIFRNFGTAMIDFEGVKVEFVGARRESYDRGSRKPIVTDGTFEDDLRRRDFTVNALAVQIKQDGMGDIIDLFDGLTDLRHKLLRTPLDPEVTFDDDPLRIMRLYRFAVQLDFEIFSETNEAASKMASRLEIVSQERITEEFLKILSSDFPGRGLRMLYENKIMQIIFPEVANLAGVDQKRVFSKEYHHKDVFYHTTEVVDNIAPNTNNVWLRFAALVHDIAKPQTKRFYNDIGWTFHGHEEMGARMMKNIFRKLKLPLTQLEYLETLVRLHLRPIALAKEEVTDSAIRRFIVEAGEALDDLITLCRADITSKNMNKKAAYLANYERVMARVIEVREKDALRQFQSPVRGEEIMQICNLNPSKTVGIIKKAIEDAILDGKIPNTYEAALEYLHEIKDSVLQK